MTAPLCAVNAVGIASFDLQRLPLVGLVVVSPASAKLGGMTTREKAHQLLDELPESEIEPIVEIMASRSKDPVIAAFRDAPEDDEPWTDEDEAAMAEVRADEAAGVPTIPFEEIKAKYGLS